MIRPVQCPECGHQFEQLLPDVTPEEVQRLEEADDDSGVMFKCLKCEHKIWVRRSRLLDPPEPPK